MDETEDTRPGDEDEGDRVVNDLRELDERFAPLVRLAGERLGRDAARILRAVRNCIGTVILEPRGSEADRAMLERMSLAIDPPARKGRPRTTEAELVPGLIHYVESNRRKKTFKNAPPRGLVDEEIVRHLIQRWAAHTEPTSKLAVKRARDLCADSIKMAKLVKLGTRLASRLVFAVHRALGYTNTATLVEAEKKRRQRRTASRDKRRH